MWGVGGVRGGGRVAEGHPDRIGRTDGRGAWLKDGCRRADGEQEGAGSVALTSASPMASPVRNVSTIRPELRLPAWSDVIAPTVHDEASGIQVIGVAPRCEV